MNKTRSKTKCTERLEVKSWHSAMIIMPFCYIITSAKTIWKWKQKFLEGNVTMPNKTLAFISLSGRWKPSGLFCHVSSNIIASDPNPDHHKLSLPQGPLSSPPERVLTPRELQFFHSSSASWISLFIFPPPGYTCCLLFLFHTGEYFIL